MGESPGKKTWTLVLLEKISCPPYKAGWGQATHSAWRAPLPKPPDGFAIQRALFATVAELDYTKIPIIAIMMVNGLMEVQNDYTSVDPKHENSGFSEGSLWGVLMKVALKLSRSKRLPKWRPEVPKATKMRPPP